MSLQPPPPNAHRLALRWTIGAAREHGGGIRQRGFEMLRLSIACAFRLFGPLPRYLVCVNSIAAAEARQLTGPLPVEVHWREVTPADLPPALRPYLDGALIEGMGWKLAPLRACPDRYELALDNDCILWDLPVGMRHWLQSSNASLLAEDAERCLGSFDALCPPGAFNCGIRGLAPEHAAAQFNAALEAVLREASPSGGNLQLSAEIEEQGLQAAALCRMRPLFLVRTSEVSICSPFWPRSPELGTCGAHFVGMNAPHIPWNYFDRPADAWMEEHWQRHRPALYEKAGLPLP